MESTYIKMEKGVNYGGIIGGYLYQTVGSGLTTGVLNATVAGSSTDKYTTFINGTGTITFS